MKGLAWGSIYNEFEDHAQDSEALEKKISDLMRDEEVTKKSGIYRYVLDGNEKHLNIREFTENTKRETYERQGGNCPKCNGHFEFPEMEGDHITPWHAGGKTIPDNCISGNRGTIVKLHRSHLNDIRFPVPPIVVVMNPEFAALSHL